MWWLRRGQPRAEQTAAEEPAAAGSNRPNHSCTGLPTPRRGTAEGLEETSDKAEDCIQVWHPALSQWEHSQLCIKKVEIAAESLALTLHQGQEAETLESS